MILVTGAESTGTRMITRMVNEVGGNALHWPMPQGNLEIWKAIPSTSFSYALIMVRDVFATISSQINAGHVLDEKQAIFNMRRAYAYILHELFIRDICFYLVSYESLQNREAVIKLFELIDLEPPKLVWKDANAKYYGGDIWEDHRNLNGLPMNDSIISAHKAARQTIK